MENDVLKNEIVPWQEKGRWYKFVIENDSQTTYKIIPELSDDFIINNFAFTGAYAKVCSFPNIILDTKIIPIAGEIPLNAYNIDQLQYRQGQPGVYISSLPLATIQSGTRFLIYVYIVNTKDFI